MSEQPTEIDYRYGTNPLAACEEGFDPHKYKAIASVKAPPKMFAGGTADLPLFTTSGIDPQLLLKLPFGIRHAVAANPDIGQVHAIFEEYAGDPDAVIDHPGLQDYRNRVNDWVTKTPDPRPDEQRAVEDEEQYRKLADSFGWDPRSQQEIDDERRARAAEVNEAQANLEAARAAAQSAATPRW